MLRGMSIGMLRVTRLLSRMIVPLPENEEVKKNTRMIKNAQANNPESEVRN
jgi:hypothetical protein